MTTIPSRVDDAISALPAPACAYIYDLAAFRSRIATIRTALPDDVTVLYAMKANPESKLVATAAAHCDGVEVASGGELQTALTAGANSIVFGGPAKTDADLRAAVQAPVSTVINVESIEELRRLDRIACDLEVDVYIAFRVNRSARTPRGSHIMTGVATPFGIDAKHLAEAVTFARTCPRLRITGLHLHAVSNNLDAEAHAEYITDCFAFADETAAEFKLEFATVNAGGGIGVDPEGKQSFDFDLFARRLHEIKTAGLTLELGRYLAAEVGWYVCEVVDLKHTHGQTFAVVRGGTHHFRLPAAWGYSHPAIVRPCHDWPYPWDRTEVTNTKVNVTGELCTPRDVLARDLHVERLRIGDLLVLPRTGAYAWTISHHDFLSHPHPVVVFLD